MQQLQFTQNRQLMIMESVSRNSTTRQQSQQHPRKVTSQEISNSTWCPLKCKIQLIHSKGALLMMWVTLMNFMYWYSLSVGESFRYTQKSSSSEETNYFLYMELVLQILTPLFDWIADAWIGRYKVILYSMLVSLLGSIILSVGIIISNYPSLNVIAIVLLYISDFVNSVGINAFNANTLPYITDQMIGASGDELSAAVDWYYWVTNIPFVITVIVDCYIDESTIPIVFIVFLYSTGIALSLSSIF